MTIDELKESLKTYEECDFFLQMNDHWSHDDYVIHNMYREKICELKEKLKELGYDIENQENE